MTTPKTLRKIRKVLNAVRKHGASVEKACKGAGVSRNKFYQWMNESTKNKERYYKIIDSRSIVVEDALYNSALKGNTTAQIFWLKNRAEKRWQDRVLNENKYIPTTSEEVKEALNDIAYKEGISVEELCEREGIENE
jgi:hypothetical protein